MNDEALGTVGAALEYAERGWHVFPVHGLRSDGRCDCGKRNCPSIAKHPLIRNWTREATTDSDRIIEWWELYPTANVGITTGQASHIAVLDVDDSDALGGWSSKTLTAKTPRGFHLYYQLNGAPAKNSAGKLGPKLDVRGEGGYIVAPPSIHASRDHYFWVNPGATLEIVPHWLLVSNPIPNGQRNDALFKIAAAMHGRGESDEAILDELLHVNEERCAPPLSEIEVYRIRDSVLRYSVAAGRVGASPADAADGSTDTMRWPKPSPLGDELRRVNPFDEQLLPPSLRPLILDISERMQTPSDYAAAAVVVALAGCVNRRAFIQPKQRDSSWVVVPNLWGAIIGPPGFMKSPVLRSVTHPLTEIEETWRLEFKALSTKYEAEKEKAELEKQAWREKFKATVKKGGAATLTVPSNPTPPTQKRLILMDATTEKLHEILRENPAGVFVLRDELTGWLGELEQPGRESERAFYLTAWNGDTGFTVDRIGRGSIHVPAVCISLLGGIQPSRLRHYLGDVITGGPGDDGLFQRFQILVWPDLPQGYKFVDRPPNSKALRSVERVFSQLTELLTDSPVKLCFDQDGQQLFNAWLEKLELKVRDGSGLAPCVVAHLSKYRSLMPTLAALFALADCAADNSGIDRSMLVGIAYARQAAAFCEYLESHALRAFDSIIAPETRAARDLARHIQAGDLGDTFHTREAYLKGWSGLSSPESVRAALEVLEDAAWVRPIKAGSSASGGRPSETWAVNPEVFNAS